MQAATASGDWVLVTGASSGIGECAALGLAKRGYRVIATARDEDSLARLSQAGLVALRLDLASSASIHALVRQVLEQTESNLYAIFNNGAYGQAGAVEDLTRDALREQFETNLFGTHELTRLLIPCMRARGRGRIIQNSSLLGFVTLPYRGAYNASKFALEGLTDTLRMELTGTGIEVVSIQPGPVESRFRYNALQSFRRHIDVSSSPHRQQYEQVLTRLQKEGPAAPFTLPPEAVLDKLILALERARPATHYHVTFPTTLFAVLRRLLPYRWLQALLMRV